MIATQPSSPTPLPSPSIDRDIEAWASALPDLLTNGNAGRFALVSNGQVVELCDTFSAGVSAGLQRFGRDTRFLVQKIDARELANLKRLGTAAPVTNEPH